MAGALAGCGAASGTVPPAITVPAVVRTSGASIVAARSAAPAPAMVGHWYFEWLSQDGRRAVLRRLDGGARTTLQTRVVEVDSGQILSDDVFPELGKLPSATIGQKPNEVAELMGRLAAPAFSEDLVRAAGIAEEFPFGSCGRLSAAPNGGGIAFNAGDWLYLADAAGRVQKRLTNGAAYDPRFTPDGANLVFRRATGNLDKARAKYELFVVPTDLSAYSHVLPGTAGTRDRFVVDAEGRFAIAVASQEPQIKTCVLSIGLKTPFAVKRLACLDGGEPFVESSLSPNGRWAAITTQDRPKDAAAPLTWHLRVVSLTTGVVALDEPAEPGMIVRAISDGGLVVQSGMLGVTVLDVEAKTRRSLRADLELGHRGFFRNASELVVVRGASVAVVDLTKE